MRWKKSLFLLRMMISLSLRANITMRGFCVIPTLPSYNLLSVMLAYDFGIINGVRDELIFRMAVCIIILISNRMILIIFSSLFSLLLLL
jgi:hypothetical protein